MSTLVKAAFGRERMGAEVELLYDSPGLQLVSIPIAWTVALQIKYFSLEDEEDLVHSFRWMMAVLKLDEKTLQDWLIRTLERECSEMEYDKFSKRERETWLKRISDCVRKAA